MCARADKPGCKVDQMIVMEGPQGLKKSTVLEVIGGSLYIDMSTDISSNDGFMEMHGKLVVELGELVPLKKAGDRATQIITRKVDHFRAPYERAPSDHKRTAVLAGTTNRDDYLNDPTGGRRYMPFRVVSIDVDAVRRDRDQLWAEAWKLYKAGVEWWVDTDAIREQQKMRMEPDPWDEDVMRLVADPNVHDSKGRVTARDIMTGLDVPTDRRDRKMERRVGDLLISHGYKRCKFRAKSNYMVSGFTPCSD